MLALCTLLSYLSSLELERDATGVIREKTHLLGHLRSLGLLGAGLLL